MSTPPRETVSARNATGERPARPACAVRAQALLFDLDGTLVDTSRAVERSWREAAESLGVAFRGIEPYIHGLPAGEALRRAFPAMPDPARARAADLVLAAQAADPAVLPLPGALGLLGRLPARRWAIVTSGDERLARASMRKAALPEPGTLVTADDVSAGKPDPEPFLLAARRLGVDPRRCVAVEDSPAGVLAARAAGMDVVGLATTFPALPGATWLVGGLHALRADAVEDGILLDITEIARTP